MATAANSTAHTHPGQRRRRPEADWRETAPRRELDHRMANSLQLAADFLLLQQCRMADPGARRALLEAAERLVAVGHLHRFLCEHDGEREVELEPFLQELAALIGQGTGLHCVACADPLFVEAGVAQQLGLAVNELAINAAKHAYEAGQSGELVIEARREAAGLRVSVSDHGSGLGPDFALDGEGGLGLEIVQAIARGLGGRLHAADEAGARFTLAVPLPDAPARPDRSFAPAS